MVREFGQFLEELVKDYLIFVRGFEVVDLDYSYQLPINIMLRGKGVNVRYPTDIDVVGVRLKDNEVWLIECQEELGEKDTQRLEKKFERHILYSPFSKEKNNIKRVIATCKERSGFPRNKFDNILLADEMIKEIVKKIEDLSKGKSRLTYGRYAWVLRWMKDYKMLNM